MIGSITPKHFDQHSFDTLSLQVCEIQSVLSYLTQYGEFTDQHTPNAISALERLVAFLQADIESYGKLYMEQTEEAAK